MEIAAGRTVTVAQAAGASMVFASVASTGLHQNARMWDRSDGVDDDIRTHQVLVADWVFPP